MTDKPEVPKAGEVSSERIHAIIHTHREALDMLANADRGIEAPEVDGYLVLLRRRVNGLEHERELEVLCEQLARALRGLRKKHYECEDCWYSCPKSEEGCCDTRQQECTCGADKQNAQIDSALAAYDKAMGKKTHTEEK